ncbi:MAG: type II and III secretion system protein [Planctomycetes bacterium]|nr:type II and III secretion system protein [Planctomycetota bacterium]
MLDARAVLIAILLAAVGCATGNGERAADPGKPERGAAPRATAASAPRSKVNGGRRREAAPRRLGEERAPADDLSRKQVALSLDAAPLEDALAAIARELRLNLVVNDGVLEGMTVTMEVANLPLDELLAHLEHAFSVRMERKGALLRVTAAAGPRLALLIYPLPRGLDAAEQAADFDSLRQLSFVSRSQREEGGEEVYQPAAAPPKSHLQLFLEKIETIVSWPPGSAWFLDQRRNLLFVRSSSAALDEIEACLDLLCADPVLVEIETRFVEIAEGAARALGAELGLLEDFTLNTNQARETLTAIGADSSTTFGVPPLVAGDAAGLNFSVLGIMSEPRFRVLLRALESREDTELLSAPAVAAVNNSRATIAITRNLPFVEDYRPVFDTKVVTQDGLTSRDANVALVAIINDRNFTGIVLNVTPSVGADTSQVQLRIQPVVREQVDSIVISNGALVEGVATPAIARPIIETRFIDTQLALPAGATAVLGGLKTKVARTVVRQVPLLGSIPLLGRLFRRDEEEQQVRDLVIFVTARVVE